IRSRIENETERGESFSTSVDLPVSAACKRALAYAAEESERLNRDHIGLEHLLTGLLREKKSLAAKILVEHGVTFENLRAQVTSSSAKEAQPPGPAPSRPSMQASPAPSPSAKSEATWRDLTASALAGQLGPLIGREQELERIILVLSRRTR